MLPARAAISHITSVGRSKANRLPVRQFSRWRNVPAPTDATAGTVEVGEAFAGDVQKAEPDFPVCGPSADRDQMRVLVPEREVDDELGCQTGLFGPFVFREVLPEVPELEIAESVARRVDVHHVGVVPHYVSVQVESSVVGPVAVRIVVKKVVGERREEYRLAAVLHAADRHADLVPREQIRQIAENSFHFSSFHASDCSKCRY